MTCDAWILYANFDTYKPAASFSMYIACHKCSAVAFNAFVPLCRVDGSKIKNPTLRSFLETAVSIFLVPCFEMHSSHLDLPAMPVQGYRTSAPHSRAMSWQLKIALNLRLWLTCDPPFHDSIFTHALTHALTGGSGRRRYCQGRTIME